MANPQRSPPKPTCRPQRPNQHKQVKQSSKHLAIKLMKLSLISVSFVNTWRVVVSNYLRIHLIAEV
jgi:hypothetical protein